MTINNISTSVDLNLKSQTFEDSIKSSKVWNKTKHNSQRNNCLVFYTKTETQGFAIPDIHIHNLCNPSDVICLQSDIPCFNCLNCDSIFLRFAPSISY